MYRWMGCVVTPRRPVSQLAFRICWALFFYVAFSFFFFGIWRHGFTNYACRDLADKKTIGRKLEQARWNYIALLVVLFHVTLNWRCRKESSGFFVVVRYNFTVLGSLRLNFSLTQNMMHIRKKEKKNAQCGFDGQQWVMSTQTGSDQECVRAKSHTDQHFRCTARSGYLGAILEERATLIDRGGFWPE